MTQTVLAVGAHPDDVEFMAAGALALLRQKGWQVHIASLTPGDCGTMTHTRQEISRIRKAEATAAAGLLGGTYHCLECDDMFVFYDRPTLLKVIGLVRRIRPDLVFAPSPEDYMADHENASRLVWNACFAAGIPNIPTPEAEPYHRIPFLYYMDPVDAKNKYGQPTTAYAIVNISAVVDLKTRMLACHASQRDWLLTHHGVDEYLDSMKRQSRLRGRQADCEFAEAFRQHRGHSFPQDDLLSNEIGPLVRIFR